MPLPAFLARAGASLMRGGKGAKAANGAANGVDAAKTMNSSFPSLLEEVDCVVTGSAHCSRNSLYWLAVCATFGYLKNRTNKLDPQLPNGFIAVEFNAEENHVRFTARQQSSWTTWTSTSAAAGMGIALFEGVADHLTGGSWEWYSTALIRDGIPARRKMGDLGWEGLEILTRQPVYTDRDGVVKTSDNPWPPGDEQSRIEPTIASKPIVKTLEPDYKYTNPEYFLMQALGQPCVSYTKFPTPPSNEYLEYKYPEVLNTEPSPPPSFPPAFNPIS